MKKIFAIAAIVLSLTTASAQRFATTNHGDNTGAALNFTSVAVTLGATDSVRPNAYHAYYTVATLAGAKALYIKNTSAKKGDMVTFFFLSDGSTRVVTFTSNTASPLWETATLSIAGTKHANITFIYNGTQWQEMCRAIEP